ncbi:MAG: 50S ribosomal protein L25 [Candidatus Atribacteria bacterium]|nr:50S ribosomal protein L25 [Candidatus Atribacteria bacterium]
MNQKETVTIVMEKRSDTGKEHMKKLRKSGWVPGVYYARESSGGNTELVKIKEAEVKRVMRIPGVHHHLLQISIDGEVRRGIIKEIQRNPVREEIVHIDFYGVKADQKITLTVPVIMKGEAPGVKAGGVLEAVTKELEIECLPDFIPESIEVDVSGLEIGDSVHVRELKIPEGVSLFKNIDEVIVVVTPPEIMEEVAPAAAEEEEITEPEVVKKSEKKEEGAEK